LLFPVSEPVQQVPKRVILPLGSVFQYFRMIFTLL
jgi:hypothetical protein